MTDVLTEFEAPDPFDMSKLIVSQDYLLAAGTTELLTKIKVGKPDKQEFIRIHPGAEYHPNLGIIQDKTERDAYYIVPPAMMPSLQDEFFYATVYTGITKLGALFVWPVRLPGSDGRDNPWHETARIAATTAMKKWLRVVPGKDHNRVLLAASALEEPTWPTMPFKEILRTAFRPEGIITSEDHPMVAKLRGQE
jgi:hypothetical protein